MIDYVLFCHVPGDRTVIFRPTIYLHLHSLHQLMHNKTALLIFLFYMLLDGENMKQYAPLLKNIALKEHEPQNSQTTRT